MPQGLKAAPSTCQRLMDFVLRGTHKYAGTLTDDTMVFSKTFEEHLVHVTDMLQKLRMAGLTANNKKCSIASNSTKILGHLVKDGLIYPNDEKMEVIRNWPTPKTKKQVKSFLGLTEYFRDHIHNYAAIAYPLTETLHHGKPDKII